jgi:hypothetical protein
MNELIIDTLIVGAVAGAIALVGRSDGLTPAGKHSLKIRVSPRQSRIDLSSPKRAICPSSPETPPSRRRTWFILVTVE